jgi:hypothetical protein
MTDICDPLNGQIAGCSPIGIGADIIGGAAQSAWESVCKSFGDAAVSLLKAFADVFVAIPPIDLASGGVSGVYSISLGIAGVTAAFLLIWQVVRTATTHDGSALAHDGSALAHGMVGLGKAGLALMLTLTVAGTSLIAADEIAAWIVQRTFGSSQGLKDKLATVFAWQPNMGGSLLLIMALIGIVLVVVLWFELLLRNAAIAILIATSPIAAAGQISETTRNWWSKLVAVTAQLVILKPLIALVFALGFTMTGSASTKPSEIHTLLAGMLILLLAVLAWPAVGRFFTFAGAHMGGSTGLAGVLGFAGGRMSAAGGGSPGGVSPDQFSRAAESRTMAGTDAGTAAETESVLASGGISGGSAAGGAGAAGGAAAGAAGAVAAPLLAAKAGVDMAQRAVNSLVGRMEQTAGHAGYGDARPYAQPAGVSRYMPPPRSEQTGAHSPHNPYAPPPTERQDMSPPSNSHSAEASPSVEPMPAVGHANTEDHWRPEPTQQQPSEGNE